MNSTPNKTTCCALCRIAIHTGEVFEGFRCYNPSCECHSERELNIVDRVKSGAEISDSNFTFEELRRNGKLYADVINFIKSLLASEYDRGYKQGVKDEIQCLETSGEHGEAVKKLLASERSRIRKLVEGMKKDKDPYYDGIYNQALSDVLELLN